MRLAAILSIVVGIIVICGWAYHTAFPERIIYGLTGMKFNAALGFLLVGTSLVIGTLEFRYSHHYSSLLAIILLILAGITLSEDIFQVNIGIDEFFVRDVDTPKLGRMAEITSFCFILMAFALINLKSKNFLTRKTAQYILHLVSIISFTSMLGYIYGVPDIYKLSFLAYMALHTSITFLIVSISASLINPTLGFTGLFTGVGMGNIMAKRLVPLVVIVLLILGGLRLEAHRHALVGVEFGIILFAVSSFLISLLLIANTARHLNKIDSRRNKAEYSLQVLNRTLEEKVIERTKDLKESERKFYKIFNMSPVGLTMSNVGTGKFVEVNQTFTDLTGYSKEEAEDKTPVELGLIDPGEREKITQLIQEQGYLKNHETYFYTKSGEKRNSLMSLEIIDMGEREIALVVLHDVTEQKIAEQELKNAKRIAEESSIAKETFMANMSHEIRTPMNAIIGFTNLIEKGKLNKEQSQYLHYIKNSGENLLVLINDILDYSKIEAGMMRIESVPFKIAELAHSIEVMFSKKARDKKLELITEIDQKVPDILIGDPTRLTQILINLLSNAIKFTKEGIVKVIISLLSVKDNQARISLSIIDTGIGIPENKLKNVFERFMQASSETTRSYGGTGLGLSIVKRLVELQNGEISVKSIEGKGTEFNIILPYSVGEEESKDVLAGLIPDRVDIRKFEKELKVLLAEDNGMNQVLAKKVLSGFGCDVDIAENGGIALEMVRNKKYDLVLMDIQMPIMDGYTASRKIRDELNITIPIIAMTAHVMAGEREKCIGFGMTDYISKPFKADDLYNLISKSVTKA